MLDPSFGCGRCLSYRSDQCAADSIRAAVKSIIRLGDIHDGRIELLLDQLILSESLLADSEFGPYVSSALPVQPLELVVFGAEDLLLLAACLILDFELLNEDQVLLVHVLRPLQLVAFAQDGELKAADLLITLLLKLSQLDEQLIVRGRLVSVVLL